MTLSDLAEYSMTRSTGDLSATAELLVLPVFRSDYRHTTHGHAPFNHNSRTWPNDK